jgi:DNA-binding response OmpR family regulator
VRSRLPPSVLVVDDDVRTAGELQRALAAPSLGGVHCVASVRAGMEGLAIRPTLIVTEARLPDGDSVELVRSARKLVVPPIVIVVSESAEGRLVALLLQQGADAFLDKPLCVDDLRSMYESLNDPEEQCRRMARLLVGRIGLKEAQLCLRGAMHGEALARTGGSRRAAANVLRVDRRYVQRMAAEQGELAHEAAEPS